MHANNSFFTYSVNELSKGNKKTPVKSQLAFMSMLLLFPLIFRRK